MRTKAELKSIFEKTDEYVEKDSKIYKEMSKLLEKYRKYIMTALSTDQETTQYSYRPDDLRFMAKYSFQEDKNAVYLELFNITLNTKDNEGVYSKEILGIFEVGTDKVYVKQGNLLPKAVEDYKVHIENHIAGMLEKYINR